MKNLSVFFPLYNEEGNVKASVEKAILVLENLKQDYEIILVNDGSSDNTGKICDEIAEKNPKVKVIHHQKNLGYGEALKSGFYNAKYEIIVYTDGDGQFDFGEVDKFLEKIEDNDLVIGYRIKRQDPFFRILFKRGWRLSLLTFFGLTLKDVDCGFKMVRKEVLEKISHLESQRGAMINAELAIKAKKAGFKIAEVGVNHYPRLKGVPTGANLGVITRSYFDLLKLWWKLKDQKFLFILLVLILALAAFLRFYKLSGYMTFLGDEGRDALIIKDMLVNHHFPLIGPPTSVGNIYLGPLYYYMMGVSMAIFWLNPVAAAGMVALIGVMTVYLVYYLGKTWFGRVSGLVAAFLYAISPVNITYSKSSWNPNPAPMFSLIAMIALDRLHKDRNFNWLILVGAATAAAVQMHYLALILLPIVGVIWLYEIFRKETKKNLVLGSILGIITFLLIMSPLFMFDLRHNFLNYQAVVKLFTKGNAVQVNVFENLIRMPQIFSQNLIGRYIAGQNPWVADILSLLILVGLILLPSWPRALFLSWLLVGLLGLSFINQTVYDHYLGFLNPAPFLLLGALFWKFAKNKILLTLLGILVLFLFFLNFQASPLNYPPNNQLQRTQDVAKFIISKTGDKPFNFALLAKNNYDAAYQFYLDQYNHPPMKVPFNITSQLFVVCEDPVCDPTHNAKYEIAGFGMSKQVWEEDAYGVKIYKLIANPTGKP